MTDWKDCRNAAAVQALDIGWYPPPADDRLSSLSRLQMFLTYWKLPSEVNELFGLNRRATTAMSGEDEVKRMEPRVLAVAKVHVAALALATFIPLAAQAPKGWKVRLDRSTEASDPDASGAYTLKGTFTLMRPSGHVNYYGLVFGGSALEGAQQRYLYFVVAQDGTWLLKSRNGNATRMIGGYTPNDSVKMPDATGKSTNALEVRVGPGKIDFVVNGVVVHNELPPWLPARPRQSLT